MDCLDRSSNANKEKRKRNERIVLTTQHQTDYRVGQSNAIYFKMMVALWLALFALSFPANASGFHQATGSAARVISFDGKGFIINGRREFLMGGEVHYLRIPRELWRDRLLRIKRAGLNTVQIYCFWNVHEPREGEFCFSGDYDLGAFLDIARELGLYVIVRPGPYTCAEQNNGGIPVWLHFKEDIKMRTNHPGFLAAVKAYWDRLLPIIMQRQIHKGGSVICMQIENELENAPPGYFEALEKIALKNGLEVPYYFSAQHHGSDPILRHEGDKPWDNATRHDPWYTSEFWTGWYTSYGAADDKQMATFNRALGKMLAFGASGICSYMFHGGSNFDFLNDDMTGTSYDYSTSVGEGGDLRPMFYAFKRAGLFAIGYDRVMANSVNADAEFRGYAKGVRVFARKSDSGSIVFLHNNSRKTVQTALPNGDTVILKADEYRPVVDRYTLANGLVLKSVSARPLTLIESGQAASVFLYGDLDEKLSVTIEGRTTKTIPLTVGTQPQEYILNEGSKTVRFVIMNTESADRSWLLDHEDTKMIVCGPWYVGDFDGPTRSWRIETPSGKEFPSSATAYTLTDTIPLKLTPPAPVPTVPAIGQWQSAPVADLVRAAAKGKTSRDPQPLGADADPGAYGVYKTRFTVADAGDYVLEVSGLDASFTAFLDGKPIAQGVSVLFDKSRQHYASGVDLANLPLSLSAGEHELAFFAAHHGRDKLLRYTQRMDWIHPKGIFGPVWLKKAESKSENRMIVNNFGWHIYPDRSKMPAPEAVCDPGFDSADWNTTPLRIMNDDTPVTDEMVDKLKNVKYKNAWMLVELPSEFAPSWLHIDGTEGRGEVFLNGVEIGVAANHIPFEENISGYWNKDGANIMAIRLESNYRQHATVKGPVWLAEAPSGQRLEGWTLYGGVDLKKLNWSNTIAGDRQARFYCATFDWQPLSEAAAAAIVLRLDVRPLTNGSIWLNGRHVGRYFDRADFTPGAYLPPHWLHNGQNEIVVLDEQGHMVEDVRLIIEKAATRTISYMNFP